MAEERINSIEINKTKFRKIGYELIDTISDFIDNISEKPVTTSKSPKELQKLLGNKSLPKNGLPAEELLASTSKLLFENSLFNGHQSFLVYNIFCSTNWSISRFTSIHCKLKCWRTNS